MLKIFETRLAQLRAVQENWDSYGAPAPNAASIESARHVLDLMDLNDLIPTQILPSAEGGIGICFVKGDRYADIECSNDGEILGVYYTGKEMPRLLETDSTDSSVKNAIQKIRDHLEAVRNTSRNTLRL